MYRFMQFSGLLSKPKLNQKLNSTEFEVRLHSYRDPPTPPTPPELTMLLLLFTAQPAAGRDLCVQLYSHTQVSESNSAYLSV